MSTDFNYAIPRAKFKGATPPLRAPDGRIIPTFKKIRRCSKRGTTRRRHIVKVIRDGREYTYHATKGWRVNKA